MAAVMSALYIFKAFFSQSGNFFDQLHISLIYLFHVQVDEHTKTKVTVSVSTFKEGRFSSALTQCALSVEKMGQKSLAPHVKSPEITAVMTPYTTKTKLNTNKTSGKQ